MDSEVSTTLPAPSQNPPKQHKDGRDFLDHLEAYLKRRDGVDKLLHISIYVTKIILASSILPQNLPLTGRLKRYESSVGLSRKAYKLGKFIRPINAFRNSTFHCKEDLVLSLIASGGDSLSLFLEQFIWLAKLGVIDDKNLRNVEKISAWADYISYIASIYLTLNEWIAISKQNDEHDKMTLVKKLSIFQDLSGLLRALADIRDGKGRLSEPLLLGSAGLLSAIITSYKIWKSC